MNRSTPDTARIIPGLRTFAAGLCSLVLGSCVAIADEDGDESSRPTGAEVIANTVDNTIVVDIEAFRAAVDDMRADVDSFCAAPDEQQLDRLQMQWRSSSEAWSAVAPYNLGPLDDDVIIPKIIFIESMRQRGTDYTDTVREAITAGVDGDQSLDGAFFENKTFDEVGMLALEVLVFEDSRAGHSNLVADIVADYRERPRKCEYLQGIAQLLLDDAVEVERGWNEGFGAAGEPFRETMLGEELADGSEPLAALIIALVEHLEYVKVRKLEAIPDARLSGHFYPNLLATMTAVEKLLVQPTPEESFGLLDFMDAIGAQREADETRANLRAMKEAAARQDRAGLLEAIGLVEGNLKREVAGTLGIELGINFSDGD